MSNNTTQKLIDSHLESGTANVGDEIGIVGDQTLTQGATGTLVMLELEAMGLNRVRTECSVQYVDHNLIQEDNKNPDDHLFLQSACQCFGLWYSAPGNGVSHPLHMERFGIPGKTLIGSDSHTCAAGALGMLAIGAGGLEVATVMAGLPYHLKMPSVWGVKLTGELPDWVSAKDVILEMLRRHGVDGGIGRIVEYYGPGLQSLSVMDRHVIANMGAELGATATVFPSDQEVKRFLTAQGRADDWQELIADADATYDIQEEINLTELEPLIALPSSPGNVVPVREVAGREIYQAYIGSSANPGFRDFAVAAEIIRDKKIHENVSFDVNPTSRQILANLIDHGYLLALIQAGARIHQAGCNGCIGMGQAPATGRISLRTVPRNFPGRSGTREDQVYLVSPETAAASALNGKITDPRELDMSYPRIHDLDAPKLITDCFVPPLSDCDAGSVILQKGPNIAALPDFERFPNELTLPVLLKVPDNVSTDEIMPAGTRVLPYRSNIPKISQFCFERIDDTYADRALDMRDNNGHAIVGGSNYGQGSSREHAALAPRYLGLRIVLAKSYARIHWENLVNFGILPLVLNNERSYDNLKEGDAIYGNDLRHQITQGNCVTLTNQTQNREFSTQHQLSQRQIKIVLAGGLINWIRNSDIS